MSYRFGTMGDSGGGQGQGYTGPGSAYDAAQAEAACNQANADMINVGNYLAGIQNTTDLGQANWFSTTATAAAADAATQATQAAAFAADALNYSNYLQGLYQTANTAASGRG